MRHLEIIKILQRLQLSTPKQEQNATLTVGKIKKALGEYPLILRFLDGREDSYIIQENDLLLRSDYVATKLWSKEDIADCLKNRGYEGNEEQIKNVLKNGTLEFLGDCTDEDWEIIDNALDISGYPCKNRF